jgi:leader peptidase (prepilin peptidase) / N-methyltransferase
VSELQLLATSWGGCAFAVVLGLLWGSFANVCIYRWPPSEEHPKGRSVVKPDSHCFKCLTPIRWYDNVPVLSYLWLRGRCRNCKTGFSPRYVLVELVTGALFGCAWWFTLGTGGMFQAFDNRMALFAIYAAFVWVMVVITFIDIDHKLILNKVTYPSIVLAYACSLAIGRAWWEGLLGIAIGYGVPWLIGTIYLWVRKREGLGLGDGTLLALVGALLGWKGVVVSLFGGSMIGSVIGIFVLVRAKKDVMQSELPFGPFLAAAAVFYLFAEPFLAVYFRLL